MDTQNTSRNQGIQVISRAADILRSLGESTEGQSLGQIARRVDLPRSTVQRIVSALVREGFVSSDGSFGGIRLGPEILNLARASTSDMRERLRPVMKQLSERTGETVDLATFEKGRMLFIDQVEGSHRLRTVSSIGESFPMTTTANGKAALARMNPVEAAKLVIAEVEAGKGNGRSIEAILDEIAGVRETRLAYDIDEHTDGISAVGFAVQDQEGQIFAVSTPVPSSRYQRIRGELSRELLGCLEKLTADFA